MFYGDYSILQISGQSFVSNACACLSFVFDVNLRRNRHTLFLFLHSDAYASL